VESTAYPGILNGKANLTERFAEIDIKIVRDKLKQEDADSRKYPKGMARLFRIPHLPDKLCGLKSGEMVKT